MPLTCLFQDAGRILCDKVFFAIAVHLKNFIVFKNSWTASIGRRFSLAAARGTGCLFNRYVARADPHPAEPVSSQLQLLYPDCSTRAPFMQPPYLLIPLKYF